MGEGRSKGGKRMNMVQETWQNIIPLILLPIFLKVRNYNKINNGKGEAAQSSVQHTTG